jgi:protein-disulfide isomerase
MKKYAPFFVIALVLVVALAGGSMLRSRFTESAGGSPSSGNQPDTAARDTPITVEEFGDYQCPLCGSLHPELKKIQQEYGPRINFIFRNFPLTQNHRNALPAAQAAEAARLQGRFGPMHDLLYENQAAWKDQDNPHLVFMDYARQLGLDQDRFERDLSSPAVMGRINQDVARAQQLQISGTPTILLDGYPLGPEFTNPQGIRQAINQILARRGASR